MRSDLTPTPLPEGPPVMVAGTEGDLENGGSWTGFSFSFATAISTNGTDDDEGPLKKGEGPLGTAPVAAVGREARCCCCSG